MSAPVSARSGWLQRWLARWRPDLPDANPATAAPATAADAARLSLKTALARRRRNERVRNDELNRLRELMRSQALEAGPASGSPSSVWSELSALPSALQQASPDASAARSRTIEQIARIESQMARHWGGRSSRSGATRLVQTLDASPGPSRHLDTRAAPSTLQPKGPPDRAQEADARHLNAALTLPTLAQAAQGFAQGHDAVAERGLRALMAQEPLSLSARVAGLTLLDLYHARADTEAFDEFAAEFAERFGVPVPRWPGSLGAQAGAPDASPPARADTWVCPLLLDVGAVAALERVLLAPGHFKCLDFTGLLAADQDAAQALLALAEAWMPSALELCIVGSAVLRRRLKASTPSGRSENAPVWWLLRLSLLRTLRRRDEFDLVALDYCVTYGVEPPPWELPLCTCQELPACPQAPARAAVTQLAPDLPALSGSLSGDCSATWAELERALPRAPAASRCVIDCQGLLRVDFVAASGLMQTLLAARQRGLKLELHGLSRLLAAYFHTLGLDEIASLRLRHY